MRLQQYFLTLQLIFATISTQTNYFKNMIFYLACSEMTTTVADRLKEQNEVRELSRLNNTPIYTICQIRKSNCAEIISNIKNLVKSISRNHFRKNFNFNIDLAILTNNIHEAPQLKTHQDFQKYREKALTILSLEQFEHLNQLLNQEESLNFQNLKLSVIKDSLQPWLLKSGIDVYKLENAPKDFTSLEKHFQQAQIQLAFQILMLTENGANIERKFHEQQKNELNNKLLIILSKYNKLPENYKSLLSKETIREAFLKNPANFSLARLLITKSIKVSDSADFSDRCLKEIDEICEKYNIR